MTSLDGDNGIVCVLYYNPTTISTTVYQCSNNINIQQPPGQYHQVPLYQSVISDDKSDGDVVLRLNDTLMYQLKCRIPGHRKHPTLYSKSYNCSMSSYSDVGQGNATIIHT